MFRHPSSIRASTTYFDNTASSEALSLASKRIVTTVNSTSPSEPVPAAVASAGPVPFASSACPGISLIPMILVSSS